MSGSAREPRLGPLPQDRWDDDVVAMFHAGIPGPAVEKFLSTDPDSPPMPNVLSTLAHHPRLATPWLQFNDVLLRHGTIEARLRELMILRVAWLTRSTYEWVQHARFAGRFSITPDEVEAVTKGADGGAWSPLETTVLHATDELVAGYRISDDTWTQLATELDERQLVEVVFVIGGYASLAMAFNSFELQLDPEIANASVPALPER